MKKLTYVISIPLLLISFSSVSKITDDKWVTKDHDLYTHTYHQGTVNESVSQAKNSLSKSINDNNNRANSGIAGVAALSAIPYSNEPLSVGVGVGSYRNGNAIAVGFSGSMPGTTIKTKVGVAFVNDSSPVVSGGFSMGFR